MATTKSFLYHYQQPESRLSMTIRSGVVKNQKFENLLPQLLTEVPSLPFPNFVPREILDQRIKNYVRYFLFFGIVRMVDFFLFFAPMPQKLTMDTNRNVGWDDVLEYLGRRNFTILQLLSLYAQF